jgi:hypothetical protein
LVGERNLRNIKIVMERKRYAGSSYKGHTTGLYDTDVTLSNIVKFYIIFTPL